jgi:hypothetical protein
VLERVVENWLDRANERTFEVPFCHMLAAEGHTVIHLTRHCAMEMGKDVLSVAPDGIACAYQLKGAPGARITLGRWRDEIERQVFGLVTGRIVHPSVPTTGTHRAYFVTNGGLEEEVIRAIDDMNAGFAARGTPELRVQTIVRGQLLKKARDLETNLWPTDLPDVKELLELYLEAGDGPLPKPRLARLLERVLLDEYHEGIRSQEESNRSLASAAILCALATANFSLRGNHWAEIEAWTLYAGYVLSLAQRGGLPKRSWRPQFIIAERQLYNLLIRLSTDLAGRSQLIEGLPMVDGLIYPFRMTLLIGLLSVLALWPTLPEGEERDLDFLYDFCDRHRAEIKAWGEGAVPCVVALFWHSRRRDSTPKPDFLLRDLAASVAVANAPKSQRALSTPYYGLSDMLPHVLGIADEPLRETFHGRSYALEGLVHLFARRNWKQAMRFLWPDISQVRFVRFYPEETPDFFRWRCREGLTRDIEPHHTQSWGDLVTQAEESKGECVPVVAREFPAFVLLYLIVCPHRMNSETLRWLDTQLS